MDKPVSAKPPVAKSADVGPVTREEAEAAVRTLIRWIGDDPDREGLRATPSRVVRAYEEWFAGYKDHPSDYLMRTFEETGGYDEVVVLRDIRFESHCEHHMCPVIGKVHIGYLPRNRVVGISKLARLVDVYAKRLQNLGKDDCRDRDLPGRSAQAARRCGGDRGHASVHDHARHPQDRRQHGDKPHARRVSVITPKPGRSFWRRSASAAVDMPQRRLRWSGKVDAGFPKRSCSNKDLEHTIDFA